MLRAFTCTRASVYLPKFLLAQGHSHLLMMISVNDSLIVSQKYCCLHTILHVSIKAQHVI